jgi:hypothetical protein
VVSVAVKVLRLNNQAFISGTMRVHLFLHSFVWQNRSVKIHHVTAASVMYIAIGIYSWRRMLRKIYMVRHASIVEQM